jgi:CMP-N,N'-diacetyllegionaminic acid synthase
MKVLAIIPARRGSKRVPGKNIKMLAGKPLVQYSIEHALAIKLIDEVCVTTDDPRIFDLAIKIGAKSVMRPSFLASDDAKTIDVVSHVLELYRLNKIYPEYVLLLQPTTPFRFINITMLALEKLFSGKFDSVNSYIKVDFYHPNKLKISDGLYLHPYAEIEDENISRANLKPVFCRDGSIYSFRTSLLAEKGGILGERQGYVVNDEETFVNIDTMRDWALAEVLASQMDL